MSSFSKRSFASGEITPALYARVDLARYATGLKTCRNFYVMRHGGVTNRPGSQFVCEVKESSLAPRLIEFIFNNSQTYILEFGNFYMRVIKNGVQQTLAPQSITAITNANPCVLTYSGSDNYANGDEVYVSGISGAIGTYLNNRNFRVSNVNTGANTFELKYLNGSNVDSSGFGSYGSGGTIAEVYTISSPYDDGDIPELKYVQSGDVITMTHPSYPPYQLSRTGDTSWTFTAVSFVPEQLAPTGLAVTPAVPGAQTITYKVTAVNGISFEESLPVTINTNTGTLPTNSTNFNTITWTPASGATTYNIYRAVNNVYGLVGIAEGSSFVDIGAVDPDTSDTPPYDNGLFNSAGEYPSAVTYYQQRLFLANTDNDTEAVWGSRIGSFTNFTTRAAIQDDDAVNFSLAGRRINEVHHLLDLGNLVVFTESGEWAIQGDSAGIITPGNVNPKQYSYNGSNSNLEPIVIGNSAIYLQSRGSIVRDLGFDYTVDGYQGNDLTISSSHLFDKYTLSDWTYQQIPHSIVWAVRDDGILLGLTYLKDQQLIAWHKHDFEGGTVESVCSVPEDNEDTVYLIIKRTINGENKKYIEKFTTRKIEDIVDSKFMDSNLTYDGTNLGSTTMTISGSGFTVNDTLTLTASASFFSASDVGNQIHIYYLGETYRLDITLYTSATVVSVIPTKNIPVGLQAVATTTWARAVDQLSGLWHLEGKDVSIFADGFVVANPNNDSYLIKTVANGSVTLDRQYAVIHVGLPYTSDLETLNIDTATGETVADKKMLVSKVTLFVEDSRGGWVGRSAPDETIGFLDGLTEIKIRSFENYDSPIDLVTGTMDVNIKPEWNSNGRIFIRQTDPVPMTVLAVVPAGKFPFGGS